METAEHIRINGAGTYRQDIQSKSVHVAGHGRFEGSISTDSFKSSGSCHVKGHCSAKQLSSAGHGHFHSISAERIDCSGSFRADQSVDTQSFSAKGSVIIGDTLTAGDVNIRSQGVTSSIKHLIAEGTIEIGIERRAFLNLFSLGNKKVVCSSIKGRKVEVSYVEANLIIGEDIRIGPKCKIGEVRYSKQLDIDPSSVVERTVQI
ncbi:hypothetical protein [Paenibacillus agilis]|uniref:Polymer-forming cytoskeletal protein n=1 Tax=Paenibacillus agilis TaxID=3020863 RepID=A0A559IXU6_9BACL|nr:hypothetical protein [Paenibacillus agilis]TVX92426.1 hypothetical protein FPZ44_04745 [Paenibacillus agilis]